MGHYQNTKALDQSHRFTGTIIQDQDFKEKNNDSLSPLLFSSLTINYFGMKKISHNVFELDYSKEQNFAMYVGWKCVERFLHWSLQVQTW